MLSIVFLLLPLVIAAPTPQGFPSDLAARSPVKCNPAFCDPPEPSLFLSYGPVLKEPPIIGCDPQVCDPPEFELDISKRSTTPVPSSHAEIAARTPASAWPTEPGPETSPTDHGDGLGNYGDGATKSKRGWIPDSDRLMKAESERSRTKRAPELPSPGRMSFVDSGTGVNNGKRAVDGDVDGTSHADVASGTLIVYENEREAAEGSLAEEESSPRNMVSGTEGDGDVVGNGIIGAGKLKLKRNSAEKPHWGVGNGDTVQKRSNIGVGNFLEKPADTEVENGTVIVFLNEAEKEKRSDDSESESDQVRSGATAVFLDLEENEKRSYVIGNSQVRSGSSSV